ncbi:MAG TPA: class I SAM-dependent methyltransferase [Vicinamibacterales bacterium]|jgi:SAM-dependent methyltransferase
MASPAAHVADVSTEEWLHKLRTKWGEVPGHVFEGRLHSRDLLALRDDQLVGRWRSVRDRDVAQWEVRGWYHALYRPLMRGARVLDYGSGFGIDGLTWAEAGASVVFADIVPSNLDVLKRVASALGLGQVEFVHLHDFSALDALADASFDVLWAQGSLHNAPFSFMKREVAQVVPKLKIGGRWIQLAYPKERWMREGAPSFDLWGAMTDGETTPYCEWYDLGKLTALLEPHRFDRILDFNFHGDDFNWFDLVRRS